MTPDNHHPSVHEETVTDTQPSTAKFENVSYPVPVYCNPGAGTSAKVLETMGNDGRLRLEEVSPDKMTKIVKRAADTGQKRVLISGGDGTIGLAASIVAGKNTQLGIIPSGTLNHFAQRSGIPVAVDEAINVALHCRAQPVDVGYVNDSLFINTSSVGAYSVFVRSRNYLESRMHYLPASFIAGVRRLLNFRLVRVRLTDTQLRTPLVFIGVGERELRLPLLGQAKEDGHRALHLIAVDCHNKSEVFILVMKAIFWGVDPLQKETTVINKLVDDIELNFRHRRRNVTVALDGELYRLRAPLRYRFAPGEILVALPDDNLVSKQDIGSRQIT